MDNRAKAKTLQDNYRTLLVERGIELTTDDEIVIFMIVERKFLLGMYEELYGPKSSSFACQVALMRLSVIELLWGQDRWREPWTSLADQEFPGQAPTDEDFAAFMIRAVERIPYEEKRSRQRLVLSEEFTALFARHDYPIRPEDEPVISRLIYYVYLTRIGIEPDAIQGVVLEAIQQQTSQPDHSVWREIIQTYLLGSAPDAPPSAF